MDSDTIFAAAAQSWLSAAGTTGTYYSGTTGPAAVLVALERNVESLDDRGLMRRVDIATLPSGVVDVAICDTIEIEGVLWEVLGLIDDTAHLTRIYVGKVA